LAAKIIGLNAVEDYLLQRSHSIQESTLLRWPSKKYPDVAQLQAKLAVCGYAQQE